MVRLRTLLILLAFGLSSICTGPTVRAQVPQNQSEAQPPRTRTVDLPGDAELTFVYIPAGTFRMGSPPSEKGRDGDEGPVHRVTITEPFYLSRYEVTQAQWRAVMGRNPSIFKHEPNAENLPVDWVSWDDAQRFIDRLNRTHEATFRLPTEAEWEYAARAGTSTRFYWGSDENATAIRDHAWAHSYAEGTSHPVGQKQPNPWGLYDMSGNVWEWTQDWYGSYADTAQVDPMGPAQGERKVYRGGSWFNAPSTLRSANRHKHPTDEPFTNAGVRLVREVEPADSTDRPD